MKRSLLQNVTESDVVRAVRWDYKVSPSSLNAFLSLFSVSFSFFNGIFDSYLQ